MPHELAKGRGFAARLRGAIANVLQRSADRVRPSVPADPLAALREEFLDAPDDWLARVLKQRQQGQSSGPLAHRGDGQARRDVEIQNLPSPEHRQTMSPSRLGTLYLGNGPRKAQERARFEHLEWSEIQKKTPRPVPIRKESRPSTKPVLIRPRFSTERSRGTDRDTKSRNSERKETVKAQRKAGKGIELTVHAAVESSSQPLSHRHRYPIPKRMGKAPSLPVRYWDHEKAFGESRALKTDVAEPTTENHWPSLMDEPAEANDPNLEVVDERIEQIRKSQESRGWSGSRS